MGAVIAETTGGPSTVTVKLQLELFPAVSVAVQFTVVTPTGKVESEGGVETTVTAPHSAVTSTW